MLMKNKRNDKKSRAQRLGQETAAEFARETVFHVDTLGSYTGLASVNKPLRMLDDIEYASPRLSPETPGAVTMEPLRLKEDLLPTQDADDL